MMQQNPIITICIPTFNRGDILLRNMKEYLPLLNDNSPLLIIDNGSEHTLPEYKEIEQIANSHPNVKYVKQSKNTQFIGNIIKAFELVETTFLLFVADEDSPNIKFLEKNYNYLTDNTDIGCIRTSTACNTEGDEKLNAYICSDDKFTPSMDAVTQFVLQGNYLSGSLYNAKLLKSSGIIQALKDNKNSQSVYPHMYINMKTAAKHKTNFSSDVSVFIGKPNTAEYDECVQSTSGYFGTYAYGSRLDQFIAFRDGLLECNKDLNHGIFDPKTFYISYLSLVSKFMHLITLSDYAKYVGHGLGIRNLAKSFTQFALAAIQHYPMYEQIETALIQDIQKVEEQYLELSKELCNPISHFDFLKNNFVSKLAAE